MHYGDVYLAKAIMAERMEEADAYRRSTAVRRSRPPRPRAGWTLRWRPRLHAPASLRQRPL
jgi:hypothetical protein